MPLMDPLIGYSNPALASDPHLRSMWMVARRVVDNEFVVFALRRPYPHLVRPVTPEWELLAELGESDPVTGDIMRLPDGGLLALRILTSAEGEVLVRQIRLHLSLDGGYTWSELTG